MTTWTNDELAEIGTAEELEIASLRRDGRLRNPVTILVLPLGDSLCVRSVNGPTAAWFRGTQERHGGEAIEIRPGDRSKWRRVSSEFNCGTRRNRSNAAQLVHQRLSAVLANTSSSAEGRVVW
ncbi:MAG: DUF2255 family protein [Actinomycetota bacterium]|nr:DUF2255 family protein [Actinomycetota bacterium]